MTVLVHALSPGECPAIVLNADFRPLNDDPLSIRRRQEAINAVVLDRVDILSECGASAASAAVETRAPPASPLAAAVDLSCGAPRSSDNAFAMSGGDA